MGTEIVARELPRRRGSSPSIRGSLMRSERSHGCQRALLMLLEAGSPVSMPDLDVLSSSASEVTKNFSKKTYEIFFIGEDGVGANPFLGQQLKSACGSPDLYG